MPPLERIDRDRELLITFLQEFIRGATPQKLTRHASAPGRLPSAGMLPAFPHLGGGDR